MAAQVELQTAEVGRTGVGGRLHISPLTDSSNKSLIEGPSNSQGPLIITIEPSKPAPGPKPRLTPKPFAVEKNPTIRPILAPKPQTKPRPESTRPTSYTPDSPSVSKPPQQNVPSKSRPVSTNSGRPASTSFKPSKLTSGQTTKPVVQPFKPAPSLTFGDPGKPICPSEGPNKSAPTGLSSSSLKKSTAAEWSGSTQQKEVPQTARTTMTRAKSMGFLNQIGKEEEDEDKGSVTAVPLRLHSRGSRPRPVSAIFLPSPSQTDTQPFLSRREARRPLSADLTAKFESIGLSLHRKPLTVESKENTPDDGAPLRRKERESQCATPGQDRKPKPTVVESDMKRDANEDANKEERSGGSIKRRISLLFDSSLSCPVEGGSVQGSEPRSPVLSLPEAAVLLGVKQRIQKLTEDTPPSPSPSVKTILKPRPLPLDLTKRFTFERSTDLRSPSFSEVTESHGDDRDPQRGGEESVASLRDQVTMEEDDTCSSKPFSPSSPGPLAGRTMTGDLFERVTEQKGPGGEQRVRAALFENVVERHNVQVFEDAQTPDKDNATPSRSFSLRRRSKEPDGSLVTATYRQAVSPSSPLRMEHSFDTALSVSESRAVSISVPTAQLEGKAMTLRSRRSDSRPCWEDEPEGSPAPVLEDHSRGQRAELRPRYLRVGALQKWSTTALEKEAEMERGNERDLEAERQMANEEERMVDEREKQREAERKVQFDLGRDKKEEKEREEVAAPKRLKMLETVEQSPKPRATYFALTGQIQDAVSTVDEAADKEDVEMPVDDLIIQSGRWASKGKAFSRRNPSLEEAFDKSLENPEPTKLQLRSQFSEKELGLVSDKFTIMEEMEIEKQRESEKERQREKNSETEKDKQQLLDFERPKCLEFARKNELEQHRALERERQKEFEREKQQEFERERKLEIERQRQQELDIERIKELEVKKRQEMERRRQQELERECQRQLEKQRVQDLEKERQRFLEKERQLQLERQRSFEREKQQKLEKERQQLELQRLEELERIKEMERRKLLEFEKKKQIEREKQQQLELEKQTLREKYERREAEKMRQMAIQQEVDRQRQIEKEREKQKEMEHERLKALEREREMEFAKQRQRAMERQKQLDYEQQELEKQKLRQKQQQEKERQRLEELERIKEMEKRQLLEFEKQKQVEREQLQNHLEKQRLREKTEKEQAERMRQMVRQQETERQSVKEKQRQEEQERLLDQSPLRPKVLDLDSVSRDDQFFKGISHFSDPLSRWKQPLPRSEDPYKPAILDIDSFRSQIQQPVSKEAFPVAAIQTVDLRTAERLAGPRMVAEGAVRQQSPLRDPSQQVLWEPRLLEAEGNRPIAAPEPPRKPAKMPSIEQLLLRQDGRVLAPERVWSGSPNEPPHSTTLTRRETIASTPSRSRNPPGEQIWFPREPQPPGQSQGQARGHRRSHGAQELSRMRSRSVSRRSVPAESAIEGSLARMRSRSAHRDRESWEQQTQNESQEDQVKESDTLVHDTDSQYGTWETGLRTEDSQTPATPSSDSKPTPPTTPGEHTPSSDLDTPDGFPPLSSAESQSFPGTSTTLLDSSALRSRVQLGKQRAPRSRPSRVARQTAALSSLPVGQADTQDWLYRDSTEPKVETKQEDSDSEEQVRGGLEPRSTASSQPQRVPLFPGMDPFALKAQLKKRGDSDNQTDGLSPNPSATQLSRSPKSPFLPRASRVLPPAGGNENGEEDSPKWLRELKSKKRLSQYENDS